MTAPRMLDVYSGEAGAGEGYHRAGWSVYCIDNEPKRAERCPFAIYIGDAVEALAVLLEGGSLPFTHPDGRVEHLSLTDFAALHGSPPCTGYSRGTVALPDRLERYDRLIAVTRELFALTGLPYVIENVEDAKPELLEPLMLCGTEFGLGAVDEDGTPLTLKRHRLFESNVYLIGAGGCLGHGPRQRRRVAGSYGGARRDEREAREVRKGGYVPKSLDVLRALLGTPWMSEAGCFLCIPPVYTEHLGRQLLEHLGLAA